MPEVSFTKEMKNTHTILIPSMAPIHFKMISNVFINHGYKVEVLQNEGNNVVDEGLKHVHNDTCYPALLVIGQFIDALKSGKYDLEHTALLITQTGGGCRASNYYHLLKKALAQENMDYIPVISLNLNGLQKNPGFKLTLIMLQNILAVVLYGDLLMNLKNQCCPYEKNPGDSDKYVNKWIDLLNQQFQQNKGYLGSAIKKNMRLIVQDFATIPLIKKDTIKVGIVGEIYVKFSPLGNNHLEEFLVKQNCEVCIPSLLGFAFYCVFNVLNDHQLYGGSKWYYNTANALMKYLYKLEDNMISVMCEFPQFRTPKSFRETIKANENGIGFGVKMGEGWLLTAEMLELIDSGFENVICAQPFGCLPNHIAGKGMIRKIKTNHPKANIVPIDYDPSATVVNQENRIKLMLSIAKEIAQENK